MKRIFLFLITNLAVMFVLNIALRLFGVDRYLGNSYYSLLIFSLVVGMAGSIISLLMSKSSAKAMAGARVIEQPSSETERWLVNTVRSQAERAGIGMPEVAIFESAQPNAFATGANRNAALVAVSTGLLRNMNRSEVEAVLGHEVSHVANGDMVTLALIQGVVNTFVMFFSRIIGQVVDRALSPSDNRGGYGMGYWITTMVAQMVLGILATIIVMWFSRQREFRADIGGANLAGRQNMIAALERLKGEAHPQDLPDQLAAFGIAGGIREGLSKLFLSHPPLEVRIQALRQAG